MIQLIERNDRFYASSRDIAEKFGKEHHNVLKAFDALQVPDNFRLVNFEETKCADSQGIERRLVLMTRNGFTILAMGFTGIKAIKWKILYLETFEKMEAKLREPKQVAPVLGEALYILEGFKQLALVYDIPKHIYLTEATKQIERELGLDLNPMLLASPVMDEIPEEDVYLEPTELAKELGFETGADLNNFLNQNGLQEKVGKQWNPTFEAAGMCYKHAWKTEFKTGYNLKWNVEKVRELLEKEMCE